MNMEKYIKGFNDGYLLKQNKPQLLENVLSTTYSNDYIQGLRDGERNYRIQKVKSRTQELDNLKTIRGNNHDLEL
jgi:intein-encoded DNA endonuclease-like protein